MALGVAGMGVVGWVGEDFWESRQLLGPPLTERRLALEENAGRACRWGSSMNKVGWELA